jgi:hypothetical protein
MSTTIAAKALDTGLSLKLAAVLGALALAVVGLVPSDLPVVGGLLESANAGTNDDSI